MSEVKHKPKVSPEKIDSKEDAKSAVQELREAIRFHNYRYYVLDDPLISDSEYDKLMRSLEALEDKFPNLQVKDSPTLRVGAEPREEFGLVEHPSPMLSLMSVIEDDEVEKFDQNCREKLDLEYVEYVCEPKYDGLAVELIYEDGHLERAATRGDGRRGEDITENIRTISSLPLVLRSDRKKNAPGQLVVRGEVYMHKQDFKELNRQREEAGEERFANPRNAAAGSVRQLDPGVTAKRPLRICFYEIVGARGHGFESQWEVLKALTTFGLRVNLDPVQKAHDLNSLKNYHQEMADKRDDLPYEIDGVVYKVNPLSAHEALGVRSRAPRWALAYKFEPRRAVTRIKDIQVQVGRTGLLTPVAILEPVNIGGVEVRRASLHNQSEIERKDIRLGDQVLVERAGDVIPQVVRPIKEERDGSEEPFQMPKECPVCGGKVLISEDKKQARCTNINCTAQLKGRIQHFSGREAMDIEGLGEKLSGKLVERELVQQFSDLYKLSEQDLLKLDGFAEKSARNLLDEIERSKQTTLERFLYALGIPNVGRHLAQVLARHYDTLDDIMDASREELESIDEIGGVIAEQVEGFFSEKENREAIRKMREQGVDLENPAAEDGASVLEGLTFVFTGSLERWTRSEVKRYVERLGAHVASSVSGETDYVVAGSGAGSKLEEAGEQDVPVLDEEEFLELIESRRNGGG